MKCRHCQEELTLKFVDLGSAPPSNAYLGSEDLTAPERWYPLRVLACGNCWLVQTEDYAGREVLFDDDYAYFSSYSSTWLKHARHYVEKISKRLGLGPQSMVAEVAANDGYLLQYVQEGGIPCYGIEPCAGTAAAARERDIEIVPEFFGVELAEMLTSQGRQADLMVANNVLAHVPQINDFVRGFAVLLKPDGVATFEFPHLMRLIEESQFDTIYHEHYSYLSLTAVYRIFDANGLAVFDVEEIPTHGGSLRIYAQRSDTGRRETGAAVASLLERELETGMRSWEYYAGFQVKADQVKNDLLAFLLDAKSRGKTVAAYGAAAKGNTLLNYAGVRPDLISFVVDRNPAKQGKYMPGSRISVVNEDAIERQKPDYMVVLPWNLRHEVVAQLNYISAWGAHFVTAVPQLEVIGAVAGAESSMESRVAKPLKTYVAPQVVSIEAPPSACGRGIGTSKK